MLIDAIRFALGCGAAQVGGPLSEGELALVKAAGSASDGAARAVRAAIRDGEDPLGDMLAGARPAPERRRLGVFYTAARIREPMLDWVLERRPRRLIDPGCGSGRFSVAAARRRRDLEIVAVDVDPAATLLTRAALAAVGARNARVVHGDYLRAAIPAISERTAFVGNPPYVRHHDIDAATKRYAAALALRHGCRLSGLAGLHALFYLATLALHGRNGDAGAYVTSAEWLDTAYGAVIRDAFAGALGGRSLTVFDPAAVPFDDAMATAAIATFEIGARGRTARLDRIGSIADPLTLGGGRAIARRTLAGSARWSAFLRGERERTDAGRIGALFRVSRGQVTGANHFFVMRREQARERGIEAFCVPVIAGAGEVFAADGVLRDNPHRLVALQIPKETDLSQHASLAAYVRAGESSGVASGYVASRRRPWYAVTFARPPVVATYMARQAPRFARNVDGLAPLNVVHGLYPRRQLDDATLQAIVTQLNATRERFVGRGRTYHGGLEKFEPREMENLPLEPPA